MPNQIPVVFHNGSNYDYHFIIKELTNKFEGKHEYLGENTEKYKPFSVLNEKEIRKVDKDGNEDIKTISYYRCRISYYRCRFQLLCFRAFWEVLLGAS